MTSEMDTCSIEGCDKPRRTRGYCNMHYVRWRTHGNAEYERGQRSCTVDACNKPHKARGLCHKHYTDFRKGQSPECGFDGCDRPAKTKTSSLCEGHLLQQRKGKSLTPLQIKTDPAARDELGRKLCGKCKVWRRGDGFARDANRKDSLSPYCRYCQRETDLRRHYGIGVAEYEAILDAQGGGCAVCGKTEQDNGRLLAVDHDHACCSEKLMSCGQCVRGVLCSNCNLGVGLFEDDIARLEAMVTYLRSASTARAGVPGDEVPG